MKELYVTSHDLKLLSNKEVWCVQSLQELQSAQNAQSTHSQQLLQNAQSLQAVQPEHIEQSTHPAQSIQKLQFSRVADFSVATSKVLKAADHELLFCVVITLIK